MIKLNLSKLVFVIECHFCDTDLLGIFKMGNWFTRMSVYYFTGQDAAFDDFFNLALTGAIESSAARDEGIEDVVVGIALDGIVRFN